MSNSKLTNTYYNIPDNILSEISRAIEKCDNNYPGKKKAEFLLKEKKISYENLKRYKNFFDNYIKNNYNIETNNDSLNELNPKMDYMLRGGQSMKNFVESKLKEITEKTKRSKDVKTNLGGLESQYKKYNEINYINTNSNHNFIKTESVIKENEFKKNKMVKVSLTVIFNEDNKILLLKRSKNTDWYPNSWALVGGKIEKGELPEEGLVREVREETKINLVKYKIKKIIKTDNVLEYLYLSKVNNDFVELNNEHSDYNWYSLDEIKKLDNVVPNLINYIKYVIL